MYPTQEHPTAGNGGAQSNSAGGFKLTDDSTPNAPGALSRRDVVDLAHRRNYGVRVFAERRDGVVTQQVFADLAAAERKAERVRSRGLSVRLELVHLVPVMPIEIGGESL